MSNAGFSHLGFSDPALKQIPIPDGFQLMRTAGRSAVKFCQEVRANVNGVFLLTSCGTNVTSYPPAEVNSAGPSGINAVKTMGGSQLNMQLGNGAAFLVVKKGTEINGCVPVDGTFLP